MPRFVSPLYTKTTNPKTGNLEPCYTFPIEFDSNEDGITFLAETQTDITLQTLQKCILENLNWWNTFIGIFLQSSSKLFSKPYTNIQINKITKHTLDGNVNSNIFPATVTLLPKTIQIVSGTFVVNWVYTMESVMIDIPDLAELNEENETTEEFKELNIDELPVENNSTGELMELDSPTKFYEKQRVKEARLKAKLAVYKAQRQMAQYYEKYGDNISDSDSDFGSSGEESESDFGEEVQL